MMDDYGKFSLFFSFLRLNPQLLVVRTSSYLQYQIR